MNLKRKSLSFIVLFTFIISSMYLVNAGIFSNFFEPVQLQPSVPIGVDFVNSPPIIVKFFRTNDITPGTLPSSINQPYNLIPGAITPVYVGFIAEDPNGASDLPDMLIGTSAFGIVGGGIGAPASSINPGYQRLINTCTSFDCTTGAPSAVAPFPACNPAKLNLQKAYLCDVYVDYYAPPSTFSVASPNANDLYLISLIIFDINSAISATATSSLTGFTNLPNDYLQINTLNSFNIPGGSSFNWPSLTLAGTNQIAASPVQIQNYGNSPYTTTSVTGSNLIGVGSPSSTLSVSIFSASGNSGGAPPAECNVPSTATQLQNGVSLPIQNGGLPFTSTGFSTDNKNVYACVYQAPNIPGALVGPPATSYSGSWTITLS